MEKKYLPIDCNYYDELVLLIMQKTPCEVIYRDNKGQELTIHIRLKNVYTKDKAEYLELENGTTIRLDRLVSAAGKKNKGYCE